MKPSCHHAFTLIEIMIVVTIIGLLAAVAMPGLRRATERSGQTACQMNLKAIAGAKLTWAMEEKRLLTSTPTDADLFGRASHIERKPTCPRGGEYQLNPVNTEPTCTIPGHTL